MDPGGEGSLTKLGILRRPFYGWFIVAVGALVAYSSGPGQSFTFSIFLDPIIEDTGLDRTTISALYAVGTGVSAVMVALVSRLADRFGPRAMLITVAGLLGTACFGMAFAGGFVSFFIAFASLRALGQGSLPINATLLTANWFVARRGRAMAIMGLGFAVSSATLPPLSRFLIESFGWREAYMVLGVLVWILVIPAGLLIVRDTPEDVGLHPDGSDSPVEHEPQVVSSQPGERDTRPVFSSVHFWLLALPLATPSLVSTALIFHQTSIFESRGLSASTAAAVFPFMAAVTAAMSILAGYLVDRIDPRRLFVISMFGLISGCVLIQLISTPVMAVVYAMLLGVSSGTIRIVNGVTWAHIYGRRGLGRIQGSAVMVSITFAAIGPLPLSWLRDITGDYPVGLDAMAGLCVLATVLIQFARPQPAPAPETRVEAVS